MKNRSTSVYLVFFLLIFLSVPQFGHARVSSRDPGGAWTYDLALASGRSGGIGYTEIQLGLNYNAADWWLWRNAGFYRTMAEADAVFGLDSSLRLQGTAEFGETSSLNGFVGAGARIPSEGKVLPLAEAGILARLGGLAVGVGLKSLLWPLVDDETSTDTQYFLILSGGGSL